MQNHSTSQNQPAETSPTRTRRRLAGQRVLAFGVRGSQGSGLARAIVDAGASPVLISSDPGQVRLWQANGIEAADIDLRNPDTALAAAESTGAAAAIMHLPLSLGPANSDAVDSALAMADVGLAVSVNVGTPIPPAGAPDPFSVRDLVARLEGRTSVLGVTAYLENLAAPWSLRALGDGVLRYPRPADDPIAWITALDVTRAGVAAADRAEPTTYQLAGPEVLTFNRLAARLGDGLGRSVTFERVSPAEFADSVRPFIGDAADGVGAAYQAMPEQPNPLMAPDASAAWAQLGIVPIDAAGWADMVVAPMLEP